MPVMILKSEQIDRNFYFKNNSNSTRLFFALPTAFALDATGLISPKPVAIIRVFAIPLLIK
jgi:hypothetical protein